MKKKLISSAVVAFLVSACSTLAPDSGKPTPKDPARFSYTRLHCTPDNESHFETVTVDLGKLDDGFLLRGTGAGALLLHLHFKTRRIHS